ncbi:hypothetical protein D3C80_2128890 [compost metagenome]
MPAHIKAFNSWPGVLAKAYVRVPKIFRAIPKAKQIAMYLSRAKSLNIFEPGEFTLTRL